MIYFRWLAPGVVWGNARPDGIALAYQTVSYLHPTLGWVSKARPEEGNELYAMAFSERLNPDSFDSDCSDCEVLTKQQLWEWAQQMIAINAFELPR